MNFYQLKAYEKNSQVVNIYLQSLQPSALSLEVNAKCVEIKYFNNKINFNFRMVEV